jgi:hypothetical protein
MKLSNRGVNLEAAAMLEVTESGINSLHSRQSRGFPYVRHIPEPQPIREHQFRPITTNSTLVAVTPHQTLPSYQSQAIDDLMHSHLNNIWRSLEHRLQVAKAKGDKKLIQLLETESKQMMLILR